MMLRRCCDDAGGQRLAVRHTRLEEKKMAMEKRTGLQTTQMVVGGDLSR